MELETGLKLDCGLLVLGRFPLIFHLILLFMMQTGFLSLHFKYENANIHSENLFKITNWQVAVVLLILFFLTPEIKFVLSHSSDP